MRDMNGMALVPGVNVDPIDIGAGVAFAGTLGYGAELDIMVVTYALQRWARGEETGAERTALAEGIDFTSWRMILAAAMAGAAT